jgi:hypothetical protein
MKQRWRIRCVIKWLGLVACILSLVAYLASTAFYAGFTDSQNFTVRFKPGAVTFFAPEQPVGAPVEFEAWAGRYTNGVYLVRWRWPSTSESYDLCVRGRVWTLPFWVACLAGAAVWGISVVGDRRQLVVGHCRCGYDLTGNVSGRCPECGRALDSGAAT